MFRVIISDEDDSFCRREKRVISEFYGNRGIDVEIDILHAREEIVKQGNKKIRIPVDEILYVDSAAHKLTYHLTEQESQAAEYTVYGKLNDVEARLCDFGFFRVHQSYLVNMKHVQSVERYKVVFQNGDWVQISKKNYKATAEAFLRLKGTF